MKTKKRSEKSVAVVPLGPGYRRYVLSPGFHVATPSEAPGRGPGMGAHSLMNEALVERIKAGSR